MTAPALLAALVDDAGLFPPEQLDMEAALARHRGDERSAHPMLTQRFLCPASRLSELRGRLEQADSLRLAMVADLGLAVVPALAHEVAAESRLALEAVEVPLPAGADQPAAAKETLAELGALPVTLYVEPQRGPGWLEAVDILAASAGPSRRGAKVRCGGATAQHFPTPRELASFIHACAASGVVFKASAGLHRAVRATDERTGFVHHGFLNLIVAACRAVEGAGVSDLAGVLACPEAGPLVAEARSVTPEVAAAARSLFIAYGSCSTSEPLEEAAALGLLPAA